MKKHLVIICGVMYPNASATGICAQRFAELLSSDYEIDIICIASDMNTVAVEYNSEIRIHALSGGAMWMEAHSKGVLKKLSHLYGQIQIKTIFLGNMRWFVNAALKKMEEIDRISKIDIVFSVCSPLSAHCAALKFRDSHCAIRWVAYTVDLYAIPERIRPFFYTLEKLSKKELRILQCADAVFVSEEIYTNHSEIVANLNNVERLPYIIPEQEIIEDESKSLEEDHIDCVFAGSLYKELRNPEVMLDIFSRMTDKRIKLHLYCTGCDDLVMKYSSNCNSIIAHGRVTYEEIQRVYQKADVLVNIGNANSDFIPSKTFEYIAIGKPIVNFYYGMEPDSVLRKYPLAFHISNTTMQSNICRIEKFLEINRDKVLLRKEVEDLYPQNSSSYVKQLLVSEMSLFCE